MKKILFIANVDWFFASHRLPIAIEAVNEGYETHLACTLTGSPRIFEEHGIVVHDLGMERSGISLFRELKALMRIWHIINVVQPEIVHLISIKPTIYGGLACRLKGMRNVVISVSGLGYVFTGSELRTRILRLAASLMYRLAIRRGVYRLIFQNRDDLGVFLGMRCIKETDAILIRGSGVDLAEFYPSAEPEGVPLVMMASRLLVDKGVREFVEAAQILHKRKVVLRMVLVGDRDPGNPKTVSENEIKTWASSGFIEYWGRQEDIPAAYRKANIVVLPSYREGMPKCLLEAAASGRAVITTDVPGCRDAIIPNVTGLLVPVKNSEAIAAAIEMLLMNAPARANMAKAGRKLAQECFDIRNVISTHMKIYGDMQAKVGAGG